MFNNILKTKLKEIKNPVKYELSQDSFRCIPNEAQLCTAWVHVISADIPMKIMFINKPSVHLTVYRGNIRELKTV